MIMGILLLLVADILIMIGCLIKRKFKASLLLSIPVIVFALVVMWFFTSAPVSLGIIKLPVIEFIKVRNICPNDSLYFDVEYESGVIELLSDKRLEDVNGGFFLFVGMNRPDFSYEDTYEDASSKDIILKSTDTFFVKEQNGKFLYMVAFHHEDQTPELQRIKKNIYCKMFFVQMFQPIFVSNEITISYDSLRRR
mgnify:CR=1 FL=1